MDDDWLPLDRGIDAALTVVNRELLLLGLAVRTAIAVRLREEEALLHGGREDPAVLAHIHGMLDDGARILARLAAQIDHAAVRLAAIRARTDGPTAH